MNSPEWDRIIDLTDVWETDTLSYQEQRDTIVNRIRESGWITEPDPTSSLSPAVERLTRAAGYDEFADLWEPIEQHARDTLVWIYYTETDIPRVSVDQAQTYTGRRVTITTAGGASHTGTVAVVTNQSRNLVLREKSSTVTIGLGSIDSIHVGCETT